MSNAAHSLDRSQPALSRQITDLEAELGIRIFSRTRNRMVGLTPEGSELLAIARRVSAELDNVRKVGSGAGESEDSPELRIATTHTHARYSLPRIIKRFTEQSPRVLLNLRQGDPSQCCQLVAAGEADIGITTDIERPPREVIALPAYRLTRSVIAPKGHPVTRGKLTLQKIAAYPIIAYSRAPSGRWIFESAFQEAGLRPRIALNAIDADVSKTYIALGMGIAILATIAYDPAQDRKLVAVGADHLFRPGVLTVVLRRHVHVSRHALCFISNFAPHLSAKLVRDCVETGTFDRAQLIRTNPVADFLSA